jgi:hypothetical protein
MFKVAARNDVGLGAYSNPLSIIAATVPSQPSAPTTALDGAEENVTITWSAPSANGSSISGYRISIETFSGTYQQDTTNCNGANETVISNRSCSIPVSVLRASPFSLSTGASVKAKIIAINAIGDSTESSSGSGAVMP